MEKLRELQKQEAITRLKLMDIYTDAIQQFTECDTVMVSERPYGALYELNSKQKQMVKDFEKEHNSLVYVVTHTYTEFGELYELFYVSDTQDEWFLDQQDIKDMRPCVYTVNVDDPYSSEFGCIGVQPRFGGLIRVS